MQKRYFAFFSICILFLAIYCNGNEEYEEYEEELDDPDEDYSYIETLEEEDQMTADEVDELIRKKRSPNPDPRGARRRRRKKKKGSGVKVEAVEKAKVVKPGDKTVWDEKGENVLIPYPLRTSSALALFGKHVYHVFIFIGLIGFVNLLLTR